MEENIALPVKLDGKKVDEKRLKEIIKTLGLVGREKHLPNELSGGQQQRVSIGRSLIMITHDPSIAKEADRIIKIEDGKIVSDEKIK